MPAGIEVSGFFQAIRLVILLCRTCPLDSGTGRDLLALSVVLQAQSCGPHYLCLKEDNTQSAACWKVCSLAH